MLLNFAFPRSCEDVADRVQFVDPRLELQAHLPVDVAVERTQPLADIDEARVFAEACAMLKQEYLLELASRIVGRRELLTECTDRLVQVLVRRDRRIEVADV